MTTTPKEFPPLPEVLGHPLLYGSDRKYTADDLHAYVLADRAAHAVAKPVAWCELTASGKIAYFDGKPMFMPGPVGNDCHTTPLYTHASDISAARGGDGGEVERLRAALARVVDCDWAYLGKDADTGNPDSLYSRVREGRKALAACHQGDSHDQA